MILCFVLLSCLILISFKWVKGYNEDCLSFEMTNAIKGIFILFVFISHINPYIVRAGYEYIGYGDPLFLDINSYIGQWIVTLFLFYSGYGVMESIKRKGDKYIASFPKKRLLPLFINFNIAVFLFIITNILLNNQITIKQSLLSFIAWDSVGNSNWYIFVIFVCYAITWGVFSFLKHTVGKVNNRQVFILTALLVAVMLCLSYCKEEYWYDTILCYGAGCFVSCKKTEIFELIKKNYNSFLLSVILLLFCIPHIPIYAKGLTLNAFNVAFAILIVVVSMKFVVKSKFIVWLGENLFPIYIYQRIPMIVLSSIGGGASGSRVSDDICCCKFCDYIAHRKKL